jgi:hypothetical protein
MSWKRFVLFIVLSMAHKVHLIFFRKEEEDAFNLIRSE